MEEPQGYKSNPERASVAQGSLFKPCGFSRSLTAKTGPQDQPSDAMKWKKNRSVANRTLKTAGLVSVRDTESERPHVPCWAPFWPDFARCVLGSRSATSGERYSAAPLF